MTVTISIIDLLTMFAAFAVVARVGAIANVMNGTTDHFVRFAAVLLIVGALGMTLAPFYEPQKWTTLLFAAGVAAWMYAEKRRNYS